MQLLPSPQTLQEHYQGEVLQDRLLSEVQIISSSISKTGIVPSISSSFQICHLREALY